MGPFEIAIEPFAHRFGPQVADDRSLQELEDLRTQLSDERFLDVMAEPWWNGPTAVMLTVFPSVILGWSD